MSIGEIKELISTFADPETFWIGVGVLIIWGTYSLYKLGHHRGIGKLKEEVERNAKLTAELQDIRERLYKAEADRDEFREKWFQTQNELLKIKYDNRVKTEQLGRTLNIDPEYDGNVELK